VTDDPYDDPYDSEVHRWWHLTGPSTELKGAVVDGFLPRRSRVLDLGCGLGSELGWLEEEGVATLAVGVELSAPALDRMAALHPDVHGVMADVTILPFPDGGFDVVIDRGCFHYLDGDGRLHYGAEAARVLAPDGRLLLRACLDSGGRRNDIDEGGVRAALSGWKIDSVEEIDLPSDTRVLRSLVVRARPPDPLRQGP
jgi:SAM-dependent methyltransferase